MLRQACADANCQGLEIRHRVFCCSIELQTHVAAADAPNIKSSGHLATQLVPGDRSRHLAASSALTGLSSTQEKSPAAAEVACKLQSFWAASEPQELHLLKKVKQAHDMLGLSIIHGMLVDQRAKGAKICMFVEALCMLHAILPAR